MSAKNPQTKISNEETNLLEIYFKNAPTSQIFIDPDLKLLHSTANAMKQFNLLPTDLGKAFLESKCPIQFPTLLKNVQHALKTNEILDLSLSAFDQKLYKINCIPVPKGLELNHFGVIITFLEIPRGLRELSHDLKNQLANLVLASEMIKSISPNDKDDFDSLLQVSDRALAKIHSLLNELTDLYK